jgi:RHS repeat-associated protein
MRFLNNLKSFIPFLSLFFVHLDALGQAAATQPATYSVSPSGSFQYQLPVDVPPGIKNMIPKLSINYNSQSGPALLGVGWNISGLSSITRSLPTIYHNRAIDPVDFDANDVFILDGQRLFPSTQSATVYQTENKNFAKIQAYGIAGGGPDYFIVETLDGLTYEYGNSAGSKMLASGKADVLIWALNKVYDKDGNYIEFHYFNDQATGQYHIHSIDYIANTSAGTAPSGELRFSYSMKLEHDRAYVDGSVVQNKVMLDSLVVSNNGLVVNKYFFVYDPNDENHLKKIENIRRDSTGGIELPSIDIYWGKEDLAYSTPSDTIISTTVTNITPYSYALGDFNGDGMTDFARTPINTGIYDMFLNNKNNDFNLQTTGSVTICSGCISWAITNNVVVPGGKMFLDFDGDGDDDMIMVHMAVSTLLCAYSVEVYISNGTYFSAPVVLYSGSFAGNDPTKLKIVPGDFDGDGKKEVLFMEAINILGNAYNCVLVGDQYQGWVGWRPLPTCEARAMDFNGDGKDELVRIYDSQTGQDCEVSNLNFSYHPVSGDPTPNTSGTYGIFDVISTDPHPLYNSKIFPGDFNGDGKADMLSWWQPVGSLPGPGTWQIHYSTGTLFSIWSMPPTLTSNLAIGGPSFPNDFKYFVADFDGDGKTDILQLQSMGPNPSDPTEYKIFYSKGFNNFDYEHGILWGVNSAIGTHFELGDFNGDGQADLLAHKYTGWPLNQLIFFHRNNIRDVVTAIEHAGHRIEIETLSLPQDPTFVNTIASSYPNNIIQLPIKITKQVDDKYQNIVGNSANYLYDNLMMNRIGRGFRGFEHFQENVLTANVVNRTTFDPLNFPAPVPIKQIKISTLGNQVVSSVENSYAEYDGGANGHSRIVVPTITISNDFSNNAYSSDTFRYSSITPNSPLYEFGAADSLIHAEGTDVRKITELSFNMGAPFYQLNKPIRTKQTSRFGNKPVFVDSTIFTYNSSGLVATKKNGPANKLVTYSYDVFGNLIKTETSASGLPNTITEICRYTVDGRFKDSIVNPLQYVEKYTYNLWGLTLKHLTPDGLTVTNEYDRLNRLVKEQLPSGVENYISYNWSSGSFAPPFSRFSYTRTSNISSSFKTSFLDYYDREIRSVHTTFKDTVFEEEDFYPNGLKRSITRPYRFSSSPSIVETFFYDEIGRVISTQLTGGATTVIQYQTNPQGLEVIETNLNTGQEKRSQTSRAGKLTSVLDNFVNTITYSYNSNGQLDSVSHNGNPSLTSKTTFDSYGRVSSTTEPNAGTTTFQYDALGRVTSQTDGNGVTYNSTYDDLGRVLQNSGPEGTYTSVYNNVDGSPDVGKISSKISPSGVQFDYTYNSLGLREWETETIGSVVLQTRYTYDLWGRPKHITYPTGNVISHDYNAFGSLYQIFLLPVNGAPYVKLWEVKEKNDQGLTTKAQYKNGLYEVNRNYSPLGYPLNTQIKNNFSSSIIAAQAYSFNPGSGNLMMRSDPLRGWQETFQYDGFNRLTNISYYNFISSNSLPPLSLEYGDEGNIKKKSDVTMSPFNWKYSGYAVERIPQPGTTNLIPLVTQDVTYTPFKKVETIIEGNNSVSFTYAPTWERAKAEYFQNNILQKTKYYGTNFERTVDASSNQTNLMYVWGGDELVAILKKDNSGFSVHYSVTDYLGSVTHILDNQGTINNGLEEERSFDAWGRMRNPITWQYLTISPITLCDRGYTGHEHLTDFNIINMNGRLYDPLVGRMFSPDPLLTDNTSSQAYNKYSYGFNNPLRYTDPSGNFFITATVVAIAMSTAFISGCIADYHGGEFLPTFLMSLGCSLIGSGVGSALALGNTVAAAAASGAISGASAGFAGGFANSLYQGNNFGTSLMRGLKGAAWGAGVGGFIGGLSKGLQKMESQRHLWTASETYGEVDVTRDESLSFKKIYNSSPEASADQVTLGRRVNSPIAPNQQFVDKYSNYLPDRTDIGMTSDLQKIVLWHGNKAMEAVAVTTMFEKGGDVITFFSPMAINHYNYSDFYQIMKHENVHGFHYKRFNGTFDARHSENVAYTTQAQLDFQSGRILNWFLMTDFRNQIGYGATAPDIYKIPLVFYEYYK